MACCKQCNSCGCGNSWGNRNCQCNLRKAIDTLEDIQELADDFLDNFDCNGRGRCGDYEREETCCNNGNTNCGCGCGCRNNYWGR